MVSERIHTYPPSIAEFVFVAVVTFFIETLPSNDGRDTDTESEVKDL
jgi:hypothetical protein